jgi:hypothetical protein
MVVHQIVPILLEDPPESSKEADLRGSQGTMINACPRVSGQRRPGTDVRTLAAYVDRTGVAGYLGKHVEKPLLNTTAIESVYEVKDPHAVYAPFAKIRYVRYGSKRREKANVVSRKGPRDR